MKYWIFVLLFFMTSVFFVVDFTIYESVEKGKLVAYRGGGQLLNYSLFDHKGCTANQIISSPNKHIENTLESIAQALKSGFSIIHINVHRTKDNNFAVFHDWTLDCATNGTGVTSKQSMDYLKSLDAGHGYTYDGGRSYPWRGKGYRISDLKDIVETYPNLEIWINMKTEDRESVEKLLEYKNSLPDYQKQNFFHFASDKNLALYNAEGERPSALSKKSDIQCVIHYALYGWSRFFPDSCANTKIVITPSVAKTMWGWPQQFAGRAQQNGSEVYLWVKYDKFKSEYNYLSEGVGLIIGDIAGVRSMEFAVKNNTVD